MESEPPSEPVLYTSGLTFLLLTDLNTALIGLLLLLLLLLSAMISGSEVAFFSLSRKKLIELSERTGSSYDKVIQLMKNPEELLATILITNNIINVAIVLLSDSLLRRLVGMERCRELATRLNQLLTQWNLDVTLWAKIIHYSITVVLVTFLLVLFGEVLPKIYSKVNSIKVARRMSGSLLVLSRFFKPMIKPMSRLSTKMDGSIISINGESKREEINRAIELTTNKNDAQSLRQKDIMKSLLIFNEVIVKEVMKSRMDVVAVDLEDNFAVVMDTVRSCGYSRIPVIKEDLDDIVGILYVKDLLPYLDKAATFDWTTIVRREVLYTPETQRINKLLEEFRESRMHMAIVVDEYGGTAGLITLEDILEEVIGDIKDEFDLEREVEYVKVSDNQFIFEGKTLLKDIYRVMNFKRDDVLDTYKGESDSIAGLMIEIMGRLPRAKESIKIGGVQLSAYSVDKRRIKKVKITVK